MARRQRWGAWWLVTGPLSSDYLEASHQTPNFSTAYHTKGQPECRLNLNFIFSLVTGLRVAFNLLFPRWIPTTMTRLSSSWTWLRNCHLRVITVLLLKRWAGFFSLHALGFFAALNYIAVLMAPYPCDGLRASYLVGRMSNNWQCLF